MSGRLPALLAAVGGSFLAVGLLVLAQAGPDDLVSGTEVVVYEGSYEPLAPAVVPQPVRVLTAAQLLAGGLAVAGLALLLAVAGWLLGRRRALST